MEEVEKVKRRKSNFDVLPSEILTSIDDNFNITLMKYRQDSSLSVNDILRASNPNDDDAKFAARLEKALKKNFDYIMRKDSGTLIKTIETEVKRNAEVSGKRNLNGQSTPAVAVKSGLGASQQVAAPHPLENISVYVSGLPLDITEEDIEILFMKQGKLRKIKLYLDEYGKKKGDALVAFSRPECVYAVCQQFDGRDIGEGCVLSVTKANFGAKSADTTSITELAGDAESSNNRYDNSYPGAGGQLAPAYLQSVSISNSMISTEIIASRTTSPSPPPPPPIASLLPPECENHHYPVVLILNAYDPTIEYEEHFYEDLEADLLIECCKVGKVRKVISPEQLSSSGTVAVTFESIAAARECASSLDGRWFDARQLSTQLVTPMEMEVIQRQHSLHSIEQYESDNENDESNHLVTNNGENGGRIQEVIIDTVTYNSDANKGDIVVENDAVNDVEDFLNSLL